jgi:hypothetical protein
VRDEIDAAALAFVRAIPHALEILINTNSPDLCKTLPHAKTYADYPIPTGPYEVSQKKKIGLCVGEFQA